MPPSEELLRDAQRLADEGYEAFRSGDLERSLELSRASLARARDMGDAHAIVRALAGLMRLGLHAHDFAEVERLAGECDTIAAAAGDPSLQRMPLHMRAEAARIAGDLARARDLYDASIRLNRELGNDVMVAIEQANKSWVEIGVGDLDEAERLLRASVTSGEQDDYGIAFCLLGLARIELERGNGRGVALLGAAQAVLAEAGLVWDPAEQPEHAATLALARELAGDDLADALAAGTESPRSFVPSS